MLGNSTKCSRDVVCYEIPCSHVENLVPYCSIPWSATRKQGLRNEQTAFKHGGAGVGGEVGSRWEPRVPAKKKKKKKKEMNKQKKQKRNKKHEKKKEKKTRLVVFLFTNSVSPSLL